MLVKFNNHPSLKDYKWHLLAVSATCTCANLSFINTKVYWSIVKPKPYFSSLSSRWVSFCCVVSSLEVGRWHRELITSAHSVLSAHTLSSTFRKKNSASPIRESVTALWAPASSDNRYTPACENRLNNCSSSVSMLSATGTCTVTALAPAVTPRFWYCGGAAATSSGS